MPPGWIDFAALAVVQRAAADFGCASQDVFVELVDEKTPLTAGRTRETYVARGCEQEGYDAAACQNDRGGSGGGACRAVPVTSPTAPTPYANPIMR